ncbi:LysM peptidoglycan-binding domain-containing protein [Bacteroides congonensis]|uniref:LysM peptidoglycan-binding domain-containing protein n=1 Tax=Bacteroides congonensis TaxID=1871006 RepID=UPI003F7358E3
MKPINRIFLFLLFISVSYAVSYAQENQSYFLHTIEKGQSLYSISKMYNVTTSDIIRLNPGCDEKIYAGQTIKIPKGKESQKGETFHTIQAGETLYKLTTMYNVSAKDICEANPGLSAENFRIGQVILIPQKEEKEVAVQTPPVEQSNIQGPVVPRCKDMHKVKRKETIFSVSREYGISEQELIAANPELKKGMKKGQFLCIPYPAATTVQPTQKEDPYAIPPSNSELFRKSKETPKEMSTIKAAIVLPFQEDKRMVEYYEGFLMAVDSLKRTGTSLDLYVYDSGKDVSTLNTILAKNEMKKMDVIFGPMHQNQIKPLSDFAEKNNIRLVIPFSQKGEEVFNNPAVYQINTPQSYLYSEVYEHFTRQFPNAHVIFIEPAIADKEKAEFISGLKQELKSKGVSMQTVNESATKETLKAALRNDKENIFIPTSSTNVLLIKALPQLTLLVRDNPEQNIHLFGYPEWQIYTKDHLDSFFELDVYFYSSFYTNTLFPAAVQFTNNYHKWYSKDLTSKFPNYAMLGFDTGFFFLKGLSRYGSELENNLPKMNLTPIQTGFKFQRVNNWGDLLIRRCSSYVSLRILN